MKKYEYEKLNMEVIRFGNEDVVTSSDPEENNDQGLKQEYAAQLDRS
ncbi:MAG: hypothetical protein IKG93_00455 [Clostridiales bacterium]|nr:hypothetical protein [Clostridiales bacterium]